MLKETTSSSSPTPLSFFDGMPASSAGGTPPAAPPKKAKKQAAAKKPVAPKQPKRQYGNECVPEKKSERDALMTALLVARESTDYPSDGLKIDRVIFLVKALLGSHAYHLIPTALIAAALEGSSRYAGSPNYNITNLLRNNRDKVVAAFDKEDPPVHQLRLWDNHVRITVDSTDIRATIAKEAEARNKGNAKTTGTILAGADPEGAKARGEISDTEYKTLKDQRDASIKMLKA
jgi:hypothetical protein